MNQASQVNTNDSNSSLKWYSFDNRKNVSRKISSFAMRRTVDKLLQDLL